MKLPEEYDEQPKISLTVVRMIIGVTLFISAILVLILLMNSENIKKRVEEPPKQPADAVQSLTDGEPSDEYAQGTLTPDDFDFWDMYPEE